MQIADDEKNVFLTYLKGLKVTALKKDGNLMV